MAGIHDVYVFGLVWICLVVYGMVRAVTGQGGVQTSWLFAIVQRSRYAVCLALELIGDKKHAAESCGYASGERSLLR